MSKVRAVTGIVKEPALDALTFCAALKVLLFLQTGLFILLLVTDLLQEFVVVRQFWLPEYR